MARALRIGDKVRITPSSGDGTCNTIRKFTGKVGVVDRVCRNELGYYYTLSGFKTKADMPYYFHREWLTLLEDLGDA